MVRHKLKNSIITVVILLSVSHFSPVAYAEPPNSQENCILYGYTQSGNHKFLIDNNLKAFGNNITINHNCDGESIVIINNNVTLVTNQTNYQIPVNYGIQNITIQIDNLTFSYVNVELMPDFLEWEFQYYEFKGYDFTVEEYISITKSQAKENWAVILSIVVVFTLVTFVYWHLINAYIDRNYCEEIVR